MNNWRKVNYNLHRDLGFFFFGMVVIYSISGIALNHRDSWNPMIDRQVMEMSICEDLQLPANEQTAKKCLQAAGLSQDNYKKHINKKNKLVILLNEGGSLTEYESSGKAVLIQQHKRPFFYQINALHKDLIKQWKWIADLLALGLILLCVTGVLIVKGKKGIRGRGGYLMMAGMVLPLLFVILHIAGWI